LAPPFRLRCNQASSLTAAKLEKKIPDRRRIGSLSAEEALRLTQADLKAGTGLTIDVAGRPDRAA